MEGFYLDIRNVHIAAALASGFMFLLRALAWNLLGARWAMGQSLRFLSYSIDTVLLTAALMLMTITGQAPFVTGWLTVKILFVIIYIVLAWFGLRASSRRARVGYSVAAVAAFLFIVSIARAHHPLGLFGAV